MVEMGTAFSVKGSEEFLSGLERLLEDEGLLEHLRAQNRKYMEDQAGATAAILETLEEWK